MPAPLRCSGASMQWSLMFAPLRCSSRANVLPTLRYHATLLYVLVRKGAASGESCTCRRYTPLYEWMSQHPSLDCARTISCSAHTGHNSCRGHNVRVPAWLHASKRRSTGCHVHGSLSSTHTLPVVHSAMSATLCEIFRCAEWLSAVSKTCVQMSACAPWRFAQYPAVKTKTDMCSP